VSAPSLPPRHRADVATITLIITLATIVASLAAGWTVLDEARKNQAETITDLRVRVATLEGERMSAARLEERMAAFQRSLAKIEGVLERIEREPQRKR
jgi:hypothetical protein